MSEQGDDGSESEDGLERSDCEKQRIMKNDFVDLRLIVWLSASSACRVSVYSTTSVRTLLACILFHVSEERNQIDSCEKKLDSTLSFVLLTSLSSLHLANALL